MTKPQPTKVEAEQPQKHFLNAGNILKKFFVATFVLVVIEEILRQASYIKNSPLFEPNTYVAIVSQWITPYIASSIVFLTVCAILLTTNKLASKTENESYSLKNKLLKQAIPLGIYIIVAIVYVPTVIQWLSILST